MPSAIVVCNELHEGLAGFRAPIEARGYSVDEIFVQDPAFMSIDMLAPDLLVIMGGSAGVYERDRYLWLAYEIIRVAERIAADLPTLGVCLGAQVMAAAMGAPVYRGKAKEVGFAPVILTPQGAASPLAHLADVPLLHWHGDTFQLPEGTQLLASTQIYPNQAFSRGDNILGLQFHPEMGEDPGISEWCAHGSAFIAAAGTTATQILADNALSGPAAAAAGRRMIDDWLARLGD